MSTSAFNQKRQQANQWSQDAFNFMVFYYYISAIVINFIKLFSLWNFRSWSVF